MYLTFLFILVFQSLLFFVPCGSRRGTTGIGLHPVCLSDFISPTVTGQILRCEFILLYREVVQNIFFQNPKWLNILKTFCRRAHILLSDTYLSCTFILFNISCLQAANYLDIKGLLDVTCKTVANMIKGKSPEEIRKTFNIKNDFTPAEEEQVSKKEMCACRP